MKDFVEFVIEIKQNLFPLVRYKTSIWLIEVSETQSKGLDTVLYRLLFAFLTSSITGQLLNPGSLEEHIRCGKHLQNT